jgi:hypothetical protein
MGGTYVSIEKYSTAPQVQRLSATWSGAVGLFALLFLLLTGCEEKSGPMPLDKQLARDSLTKFLEAWKSGEKSEALKTRSPSIVGSDADWSAGAKLVSFTIQEPVKDDGSNLHAEVQLVLQMPDGERQTSTVTYIVGTSPTITVFRK